MKRWFLTPFVLWATIALTGCSETQPKLNTNSSVDVELVSSGSATVEGKYLLRFDVAEGQYVTLRERAQTVLVKDWEVRAPDGLQILERNAGVTSVEFAELKDGKPVASQVFEIKTTLKLAATPETAASASTFDVVASFPAALNVARALNASAPSSVPEIRFHVVHHPSNSARALGRIGKDFGLVVVFIFVAVAGFWLAVKSWFFVEQIAESGCLPMFVLIPTLVLIGVGLFGVGATFYYLFQTLRDLWWIISRLWGG